MSCPHAPGAILSREWGVDSWVFIRGLGVGLMPIGERKAIRDEWHCQLPLPQVSPVWVSSAGILPPLHFSEWPRGPRASWWLRAQSLTLQSSQSPRPPGRGAPALSSSRWRTLRTSRIRPRNWPRNPAFLGWFWKCGHHKAQEDPRPLGMACGSQRAGRWKAELGVLAPAGIFPIRDPIGLMGNPA